MRPTPLRTRTDLLRLLRPYAISAACGRAMDEDRTQVLGSFTAAEGLHRYIIRITSAYHRTWFLALTLDEAKYEYRVNCPVQVPWKCWNGKVGRCNPLLDGDEPEVYARKRDNGETDWTSAYRAARSSQGLSQ